MAERKRLGVPISGIDTSSPNHSVTDGKCTELHNLRYTGGAWRNVKEFEEYDFDIIYDFEVLYNNQISKILYNHNGYLIIYDVDYNNQHNIYALKCDSGAYPDNPILIDSRHYPDLNIHTSNIFHFGNMLIISWDNSKEFKYFVLDSKKRYVPYLQDIDLNFSITESSSTPSSLVKWKRSMTDAGSTKYYFIHTWETVAPINSNESSFISTEEDHFRGEFAIFATLRAENGSVLYRTPVQIYNPTNEGALEVVNGDIDYILSTYGDISKGKRGVINATQIDKTSYDAFGESSIGNISTDLLARALCPEPSKLKQIKIDFSGSFLQADSVYDVAFYCTRLHPLFSISQKDITINDVDLMQEPFYLLKTIRKDQIQDGLHSFIIDSRLISNVEHNQTFIASQFDFLYSDNTFEYNNRVHLLGTYINPQKQPKDFLKVDNENELDNSYRTDVVLAMSYETRQFYSSIPSVLAYSKHQQPILSVLGKASCAYIANSNLEYSNKFELKYAPALAVSYYIKKWEGTEYRKYDNIILQTVKQGTLDAEISTEPIKATNKLQVSELNDPLTFPYDNSYLIGSANNKIITANSGAIEMSDSKFGEFPLYVFTQEGIFAMQNGKETLYSAIIPINYDVAINPHTLAVNGMVLYFTDKGLHALTNQGPMLLSGPIHTEDNRIPEWMYTSEMIYLPEWNEVLCTDLGNSKAYVFSLDSKVWSTRDIPSGYILNNDELVSVATNKIYNLRNEEEGLNGSISCKIVTRPIKLGTMELKRAETMIVRFESKTIQNIRVKVEGSINGVADDNSWHPMREVVATTNKDIVIHRTPFSAKYLRFTVESDFTDEIRILAFELEYYERMRHRMR